MFIGLTRINLLIENHQRLLAFEVKNKIKKIKNRKQNSEI